MQPSQERVLSSPNSVFRISGLPNFSKTVCKRCEKLVLQWGKLCGSSLQAELLPGKHLFDQCGTIQVASHERKSVADLTERSRRERLTLSITILMIPLWRCLASMLYANDWKQFHPNLVRTVLQISPCLVYSQLSCQTGPIPSMQRKWTKGKTQPVLARPPLLYPE